MKALGLILKSKYYFAPAFIFLSLNLCVGTWAVSIPQIKSRIGFSEAELGIAILCFGLGTFIMLLITPNLIKRFGLGKACLLGIIFVGLSFLESYLVSSYVILCVALFILGLSTGFIDIGMNTLVSQIEQIQDVNIMSANHGFFSLGGVLSGGLGALCMAYFGDIPLSYVLVLCVLVLALNIYFSKFYINIDLDHSNSPSFDLRYIKPLFVLLIIGFICMGAEGAVADWSALYLKDISKAEPFWLAIGFLSFSVFMTLGRFLGDAISDRYGSKKVLVVGLLTSVLGFGLVLLKDVLWTISGFGLVGFGLSVVIPELFRMGGRYQYLEKSRAIALIAGSGYIGFLIGPVFLGFIADFSSLWWSFVLILAMILLSLMLSLIYKTPKH
ncbi:MFS transporter [Flavobacterium sp. CS20]|uniref:MFS transporter n=1 Tax=Flavobacterium sp. CS20 TaxID=2775246 RepID=UPI001B3A2D29|nr:MFS transporter [Flavobacterium sp. CS20]QTY26255.1 MFS transporter [Flavobacterium sp. CS20]